MRFPNIPYFLLVMYIFIVDVGSVRTPTYIREIRKSCTHALLTKRTDVLPQDLMKYRSRENVWSHRFEIWQASRQRCWRGGCQISGRLEKSKLESLRLRNFTRSCAKIRLVNRAPGVMLVFGFQILAYFLGYQDKLWVFVSVNMLVLENIEKILSCT